MGIRDFCADLKIVISNDALAEQIAQQVIKDEILYAFAGFYSDNPRLTLSEVLANMVLFMSQEREKTSQYARL